VNEAQALAILATLLQMPDALTTKQFIVAIAQAAGVDTTSFEPGDPMERFLELASQAMAAWGVVPQQAVEALFFALATDPGDVRDDGTPDASPDQTPRPGMLSAVGQGFYGTTRGGQTYAISRVTLKNNGTTPTLPFLPGQLIVEYSTATRSDGGTPTYAGTPDGSIYLGIGGTMLPIAPGASVANVPVIAQQIGSYGSAPQNMLAGPAVSQSYGNIVVTASTTATGQDREARALYIARCLLFADAHSPGGPTQAYRRAMNTAKDGTLLARYDGSGLVNITQAYVSPASAVGLVTMYIGGPNGGTSLDATDLASAAANIDGLAVGTITDPIGVLCDTATIGPTTSVAGLPSGTPGPAICTNHTIDITYTVKIKASKVPGGATPGTYTYLSTNLPPTTAPAPIAKIFDAITATEGTYLYGIGIGGLEQVAGAGVVYTSDIQDQIPTALAGLYAPSVTAPATTTTAISLGECPAPGVITGTIVVVTG
jgi:hypothetical protein